MQDHEATRANAAMSSRTSRRHVIRAAVGAAGGATLLSHRIPDVLAHTATPVDGLTGPFVRRDVHRLPEGSTLLDSYARGIAVMKERDDLDPTGWVFQARIHGVPQGVQIPQDLRGRWAVCPHGDRFFLSWHRMYLYWFEKILRKASGDRQFSLPYWNYGDASQQALPEPFRLPADGSNHLFVPARNPLVNAGEPPLIRIEWGVGIVTTIAELIARAVSLLGEDPGDMSSALEELPHNLVHGWVGGRFINGVPGWMDSTGTAALDPVFWLHHANIDRLWKRWLDLGGNRRYPLDDPEWRNRVFVFYDEDGNEVEMTGEDVLVTEDQLGYRYDDDPTSPPVIATPVDTDDGVRRAPEVGEATPSLAAPVEGPFEIGVEGTSVSFEIGQDDAGARRAAEAPPVRISLQGVMGTGVPAVMYLVFVNLPSGQAPDPESPWFAGAVGLFSLQPWDSGPEGHDHRSGDKTIDISRTVDALKSLGEWDGEVVVTLVPVDLAASPEPAPGERAIAATPQATPAMPEADVPWVVIEGISISG